MQIHQSINNEGNPVRSLSDIKSIILHHTGTNHDSHNYLNRDDYISCQYLIKRNGEIWHLMDDTRIAYHAGVSSYPKLKTKGRSLNWCTVGIEIEGDGVSAFTKEQKESTRWLVKYLMNKYSVNEDLVLRHKDIATSRKWDVSDILWNDEYDSWQDYVASLKTNYMDEKLEHLKLKVVFAAKELHAYGVETKNTQAQKNAAEAARVAREINN